jgi:hypothetical protein
VREHGSWYSSLVLLGRETRGEEGAYDLETIYWWSRRSGVCLRVVDLASRDSCSDGGSVAEKAT